jgi:predicted phosphodiesterase
MKTIILSDTHLTEKFNPKKFEFLSNVISQADKLIINGDFWDGYYTKFDNFVNSQWQELFPILQNKETVLVLGNHDKLKYADDRIHNIFHEVVDEHRFTLNNITYIVNHGEKLVGNIDEKYPMPKSLEKVVRKVSLGFLAFEGAFTKRYGRRFYSAYKMHKLINMNKPLHKYTSENIAEDEFMLTAHTHIPELLPEQRFANSGFIRYGLANYLIVDESGVELIDTRY